MGGGQKNFPNLTEKTTVLESLFNKVADLRSCNFMKKRLQDRHFLVKLAKFLRTTFIKEHASGGGFATRNYL